MIQHKRAIHLALLLSLCSCSGGVDTGVVNGGVTITSTAPGVIQGADTDVPWTLIGTGFQNGAVVTTTLADVTIADTTVVSDTQITFTLSAANTVVAGTALVAVTNLNLTATFASVPTVPEIVTLSGSVQPIYNLSCAVVACHTGGAPPAGLDLSAGVSHGATVNVASTQVPALFRVLPGDPDSSYLVDKIEGTQAVGARMPFGAPPLDATSLQLVRKWIEAGALND